MTTIRKGDEKPMSHITRVKTEIKDADALLAALRKIGYRLQQESERRPNGAGFDRSAPRIRALKGGRTIAFEPGKEGRGPYEIAADWQAFEESRAEVLAEILRAYALEKVTKAGRMRGFSVVKQGTTRNGEIELVLRRVAGGVR